MTTTKYRAVCYVCYSCWLNEKPVGKREAARLATSHMNRYRHEVGVSEVTPEPSAMCGECGIAHPYRGEPGCAVRP